MEEVGPVGFRQARLHKLEKFVRFDASPVDRKVAPGTALMR